MQLEARQGIQTEPASVTAEISVTRSIAKPAPQSRPRFVTAILLLCGSFALCPSLSAAEEDVIYDTASGFYKKENWKEAVSEYRKFLTLYPEDRRAANARLYLGLAEVNVGDFTSARQNLRRYVELQPASRNLNHALYRIAECSYLLDDLRAAQRELANFLERFPEDAYAERAIPYLADVEMRLGNFEKSEGLFRQSLEKYPNGELADDSRFGRARSLEGLQRYAEAEKVFEELASNPQGSRGAEALLNLGLRRYEDGKYAEAEQTFLKLEETYPTGNLIPLSRLHHGFSLYRQSKYEEAIAQFELLSKDPAQGMIAGFWRGMANKNLGKVREAIEVFRQTIEVSQDDPIVESLLYQWGECERRMQNFKAAREQFQEVLKRFPEGELADDALHSSTVCALEEADIPRATELIAEFSKTFPNSNLKWSQELLRGRLLLLEKKNDEARNQFRRILVESNSDITKTWSRYYIAYSQYLDKEYRQALLMSEPLAAAVEQLPPERRSELAGIHVLQGTCLLELAKASTDPAERRKLFEAVEAGAKKYLDSSPQGAQAQRAWGLRALAAAHGGDPARLQEILLKLQGSSLGELDQAGKEEIGRTVHEIAEVAFSNKDFMLSTILFQKLAELKPSDDLQIKGLHGWGWSEYEVKRFPEASAQFRKLIEVAPAHELAADAAFMLGKCLEQEKKVEEAIAAFDRVASEYGKSKFGFSAALQKARLLAEADRKDEANQSYQKVYEEYPGEQDRDKLLDEWGLMNYRKEDFAKADELFSKLVQEFPGSALADNARLILAESRLVTLKLENPDPETLGKLDQVRDEFRKLAEESNSDAEVKQTAYSQLMGIGVAKKDWQDVSAIAGKLRTEFPSGKYLVTAIYRQGEAALNLGEFAQAEEMMRSLLKEPELEKQTWSPQVPLVLAESLLQQSKYDALKSFAEEWRTQHPESESQAGLDEIEGRSLYKQSQFAEAREAFERALKNAKPERSELAARSQFMIGESYLAEQKYENAEREYSKVEILYLFPQWQARALYQQGACQEALKLTDKAVKSYETLLSKWPDSEQAKSAKDRLEALGKPSQTTSK